MRRQIEIRERSTRPISRADFVEIETSSVGIDLIEAGIISLVRSRKHPFALQANGFVGEAWINGNLSIKLTEKVSGASLELARFSLPRNLRSIEAQARVGASGNFLDIIVNFYLDLVWEYFRLGRVGGYKNYHEISTRPKGAIDTRRTAYLMARGRLGLVAQMRSEFTRDVPVNQIIAHCLFHLERSASSFSDTLAGRIRKTTVVFGSVNHHLWSKFDANRKSKQIDLAINAERRPDIKKILSISRALVFNRAFLSTEYDDYAPISLFISLEELFENAVRNELFHNMIEYNVAPGSTFQKNIFTDFKGIYRAEPDIVIKTKNATLVFDVKYKSAINAPDHQDVYQLIAHAEAFGSNWAGLIYPDSDFSLDLLGTSKSGLRIYTIKMPVSNFEKGIKNLSHTLRSAIRELSLNAVENLDD